MKIILITLLLIRKVLCSKDNTSLRCNETFSFYYNLKSKCNIENNNTYLTNLIILSENTTSTATVDRNLQKDREKQNKQKIRIISFEPTDNLEKNLEPIYIFAIVLFSLATFIMIFTIVFILKIENEQEKNMPSVIFTSKRNSKDCAEINFLED